jgi:hypothetical protein
MTPSELKYYVEQGQDRYFFTRDNMKFFGDTMRNYGVRDGGSYISHWDETGNNYDEKRETVVEMWELYRKHPVFMGNQASAYFDKKTFKRVFPDTK